MTPEEIREIIRGCRAIPYEAYLQTALWRARRNTAIKAQSYRCQRCRSGNDLQVHHLSYDRLGAELDTDLEVLCRGCHLGHHVNENNDGIQLYMRIVGEALKAETFTRLPDLVEEVKCRCARAHIPYNSSKIHAAIARMGDARIALQVPRSIRALAVESPEFAPITKAEAAGLIAKFGAQGLLKPMAPAHVPKTVRQAEIEKASRIVSTAILDSIERCESLEQHEEPPPPLRPLKPSGETNSLDQIRAWRESSGGA